MRASKNISVIILVSVFLTGHACKDKSEEPEAAISERSESVPVAKKRPYQQHPDFPQVKMQLKREWMPSAIPLDRQEKFIVLYKQIQRGDLEVAERACKEVCQSIGNYRRPMAVTEGVPLANAFVVVWESCYWTLAGRYRREGSPGKAIPLERELVKWGSSWNEPFHAAKRLQKGLVITGSLFIPAGPDSSDGRIFAIVSLQNNNETEVRTRISLETAVGFDKAYQHDKGIWHPISHPGSRINCSGVYDITIPLRSSWKRKILVTAHQLEHVGIYELKIKSDCINCKSNTAILSYR